VFRDIKNTTVTQLRGVHIRDKIIKDFILLGSSLTVGTYSSRIVSCLHPSERAHLEWGYYAWKPIKKDVLAYYRNADVAARENLNLIRAI
jgi:hypothetical protein